VFENEILLLSIEAQRKIEAWFSAGDLYGAMVCNPQPS
jgi:hypothetical protein